MECHPPAVALPFRSAATDTEGRRMTAATALLSLLLLCPPAADGGHSSDTAPPLKGEAPPQKGEEEAADEAEQARREPTLESTLVLGGDASRPTEHSRTSIEEGDENAVVAGSSFRVRCLISNATNDAVRMVVATNALANFTLYMEDAEGGRVPPTRYGRNSFLTAAVGATSRSTAELAPGGEYAQPFHLSRLFDLSQSGKYKFWFEVRSLFPGRSGVNRPTKSEPVIIIVSEDGTGFLGPTSIGFDPDKFEVPILGPPD